MEHMTEHTLRPVFRVFQCKLFGTQKGGQRHHKEARSPASVVEAVVFPAGPLSSRHPPQHSAPAAPGSILEPNPKLFAGITEKRGVEYALAVAPLAPSDASLLQRSGHGIAVQVMTGGSFYRPHGCQKRQGFADLNFHKLGFL